MLLDKFGNNAKFTLFGVGITYLNVNCDRVLQDYKSDKNNLYSTKFKDGVNESSRKLFGFRTDENIVNLVADYHNNRQLYASNHSINELISIYNKFQSSINENQIKLRKLARERENRSHDDMLVEHYKQEVSSLHAEISKLKEQRNHECGLKSIYQGSFSPSFSDKKTVLTAQQFLEMARTGQVKGFYRPFYIHKVLFNGKLGDSKFLSINFYGSNLVPTELEFKQRFEQEIADSDFNNQILTQLFTKYGQPHISKEKYFSDEDRYYYYGDSPSFNIDEYIEYDTNKYNAGWKLRNRERFKYLDEKFKDQPSYKERPNYMLVSLYRDKNTQNLSYISIKINKKTLTSQLEKQFSTVRKNFSKGNFSLSINNQKKSNKLDI
ncbi:hypothetical protein [Thalassotalea ganghwensis]